MKVRREARGKMKPFSNPSTVGVYLVGSGEDSAKAAS
jgi:hypothetical protein